jgi:hypothetical protein
MAFEWGNEHCRTQGTTALLPYPTVAHRKVKTFSSRMNLSVSFVTNNHIHRDSALGSFQPSSLSGRGDFLLVICRMYGLLNFFLDSPSVFMVTKHGLPPIQPWCSGSLWRWVWCKWRIYWHRRSWLLHFCSFPKSWPPLLDFCWQFLIRKLASLHSSGVEFFSRMTWLEILAALLVVKLLP